MTVDLTTMNLEELQGLAAEVEKQKKKIRRDEEVGLRRKWRAEAKAKGLSFEKVAGLPKKGTVARAKAPAKYRNPTDPSQVWSGRGRQPRWVKDALVGGRSFADLEIVEIG